MHKYLYKILLAALCLVPTTLYSSPIELKLMMTSYHLSNQQKIVDFFKKSVEERSNGRISIAMQPDTILKADQIVVKITASQNALAIIETKQLSQQIPQLKALNNISKKNFKRTEFYQLIDSTLGCSLYSEMLSNNFELLAIWDSGRQRIRPLKEQAKPQNTGTTYNTYALIMGQKQWRRLPADIKVIIHEALYIATLYAFELAAHSDRVNFPSDPQQDTSQGGINELRQRTFAEFYKTCHRQQTAHQPVQDSSRQ